MRKALTTALVFLRSLTFFESCTFRFNPSGALGQLAWLTTVAQNKNNLFVSDYVLRLAKIFAKQLQSWFNERLVPIPKAQGIILLS